MDKLLDAIIANAAANVAVLVLLLVVGVMIWMLQQARADALRRDDKLAAALTVLADVIQRLQIELAARGVRK